MNRSVVQELRGLVPLRPLTRNEALQVAERQASRFLRLNDLGGPVVRPEAIAGLPRIEVRRLKPWISSGASQWIGGRWVIVLNATQPWARQKFTLAHELKHIVDHPLAKSIYCRIEPRDRSAFIEATCDYFAGCLLIPRPWLKRAWCGGMQDTRRLAQHFEVSEAAITTRLSQVGLVAPAPRCSSLTTSTDLRALLGQSTPVRYYRRSFAPTT